MSPAACINRIRLEFKAFSPTPATQRLSGINRIRLEFKGCQLLDDLSCQFVLIESDWNLKDQSVLYLPILSTVLIESDWNLKQFENRSSVIGDTVLIESDWNLKETA